MVGYGSFKCLLVEPESRTYCISDLMSSGIGFAWLNTVLDLTYNLLWTANETDFQFYAVHSSALK